jgi:hypothetical protein
VEEDQGCRSMEFGMGIKEGLFRDPWNAVIYSELSALNLPARSLTKSRRSMRNNSSPASVSYKYRQCRLAFLLDTSGSDGLGDGIHSWHAAMHAGPVRLMGYLRFTTLRPNPITISQPAAVESGRQYCPSCRVPSMLPAVLGVPCVRL